MPTTCKLIAKQTVSTTASSISFSDIPGTFTDLFIVLSTRCDRASGLSDEIKGRFNGATTDANMSVRLLQGNGSTAGSYSFSRGYMGESPNGATTSNTFGNCEIYIPNYAGSVNKSYSVSDVHETNGTQAYASAIAGLWSSTAAITQVTFSLHFGSVFTANSSAFLYGITRSDDNSPGTFGIQATGGDEVFIANGYKVHVFKSSGTFNVTSPGFVEYLVIAGGGGGGASFSGGGGAGGYRSSVLSENSGGTSITEPKKLINAGSYPIIVGAGGTAGSVLNVSPYTRTTATAGTQSSFMDIISIGGGRSPYDAYADIPDQAAGGSGAGGNGASNSTRRGGYGVSGQGTNGGNGIDGGISNTFSGGGGGAGTAGTTAVGTVAGNGGNGLASSITGTSITRAGGGGGGLGNTGTPGTGGSGGGGNASASSAAAAGSGTINTGSGGGGGSYFGNLHGSGGNGGSGIVIIRYRIS